MIAITAVLVAAAMAAMAPSAGAMPILDRKPDKAPAGATAKCKDGTYSFSTVARSQCWGHGGVAKDDGKGKQGDNKAKEPAKLPKPAPTTTVKPKAKDQPKIADQKTTPAPGAPKATTPTPAATAPAEMAPAPATPPTAAPPTASTSSSAWANAAPRQSAANMTKAMAKPDVQRKRTTVIVSLW